MISVIGSGYVGLVASVCFAKKYNVVCADTNNDKVEKINSGISPIYEPGLDELLSQVVKNGSLRATTDIYEAVRNSRFIFISVGTPSLPSGEINLTFVRTTAEQVGKALSQIHSTPIIIQRSTVVPTTTLEVVKPLIEKNSNKKEGEGFHIAFVPEFLREGTAIYDFENPDRVIIGTHSEFAKSELGKLFSDFHKTGTPIIFMSPSSAELVKYASNCFLATKISFANEIANLAEALPGVDIDEVMKCVGMDKRINPSFFSAGAGFGGSCLPKDLKALINFARSHNFEPLILSAVEKRNNLQAIHIIDLLETKLKVKDKKITILGISFKPNTSDIREAPSIRVINELLSRGAGKIIACDPVAIPYAKDVLGDKVDYDENPISALKGAECAIVITEWEQFMKLTPEDFTNNMARPLVLDTRRIYDPVQFSSKLEYIAVGR